VVKKTTSREFFVLYSDFEYGNCGHGDSVNKSLLQHDPVQLQEPCAVFIGVFTL
jgi:hypothetical protein